MNIKDTRHAHLLAHSEKYGSDAEFIKALNRGLERHPEFKADFDASYLSQLKARTRNIGDKTARKFEAALRMEPNSFDVPVSTDDAEMDRDFERVTRATTAAQRRKALTVFAESLSPADALRLVRILLDRVEAGL